MTRHARGSWRKPFLAALAQLPVVRDACEAAGVSRRTVYRTRKQDAQFAQAWQDALAEGVDAVELEAFRRGVVGVDEPIIHAGQVVGTRRAFSDGLLALVLEARRPEVYARRVEVTSPDGSAAEAPATQDPRTRALRIARMLAEAPGSQPPEVKLRRSAASTA